MGTGADPQIDIRAGNAELVEEDPGQLEIVVLAGMDEDFPVPAADLAAQGSAFDELGRAPTMVAMFMDFFRCLSIDGRRRPFSAPLIFRLKMN